MLVWTIIHYEATKHLKFQNLNNSCSTKTGFHIINTEDTILRSRIESSQEESLAHIGNIQLDLFTFEIS